MAVLDRGSEETLGAAIAWLGIGADLVEPGKNPAAALCVDAAFPAHAVLGSAA